MVVLFRIISIVLISLSCHCFAWSKEPIKIEILTDDDYPPYSYVVDGKPQGLYIEIVQQAAKLLKPEYHIDIIAMPWKRALRKIEQGESFAVLPPYVHPELRPYIQPYSIALAQEDVVTYCRQDVDLKRAFVSSLRLPNPIRLGINSGYLVLNEKYSDAVDNQNLLVRENKSTDANLLKLLKGRVDCYVNDKLSIEYGLQSLREKERNLPDHKFVQMDHLSSQTAHIGYSDVKNMNFPFKYDFVEKMNLALEQVLQQRSMVELEAR